ncbi:hypothetical protein ACFOZ7_09900 [Natribaculum luteum]|uniref:Uncharacterized protein n=1 Tax=Natribaculum luteum TaxID=1586232 RepID=A0ABD5NYY6_9EURY|nr:hypothetical protein [Natribaculum luteum]
MTSHHPGDESPSTITEPIVDYESLRTRDDVAFHEQTDVVDEEIVDEVAALADLAGVGITNHDGDLLFRRLTDTCSWKIPVAPVDPEADFATAIAEHVRETIGFAVELDGIEGVWDVRVQTADGEKTASRGFVTFSASTVSGSYDLTAATPQGDPVEDAAWFDELPAGADEIPGTELFVD